MLDHPLSMFCNFSLTIAPCSPYSCMLDRQFLKRQVQTTTLLFLLFHIPFLRRLLPSLLLLFPYFHFLLLPTTSQLLFFLLVLILTPRKFQRVGLPPHLRQTRHFLQDPLLVADTQH